MVRKFKKNTARFIALAVAVFMVLSLLPISELVFAEADSFFVKVVDGDFGTPISNATVTLIPEDGTNIDELPPMVTDTDGIAEFSKISEYFDAGKPAFGIKYTVTADGYSDVEIAEFVEISSVTPKIDVNMILDDSSNPVITGISGNPTEWTKNDVIIEVSASDIGRGVSQFRIGNNAWQLSNSFTITANGTYTVYAQDKSGNESTGYEFEVSFIDKSAPVITSVNIDPNTWTKENVTMTINATDDGIGIKDYKMDDGVWQESPSFTISDSAEHSFYARDEFDFVSTVVKQTADKHDSTKPTIDDVVCAKGWSNESIKYTVNASDDKSGIANYGFVLSSEKDDESKISWNESGEDENNFNITNTNLYSFFVRDNAGNISESYDMATPANIETEKPFITDVTLSTTKWTNQEITFTVFATDEGGSNIKAYRVDAGEWQPSNKFKFSDNAEHKFQAIDNAGNISDSFTKSASNFENVKPVISDVILSDTNWTNQEITFTVFATDEGGSGIKAYCVDGGEWKDDNTFVISNNNEHTFKVIDNAGNISDITDKCKKAAENYDHKNPELDFVTFTVTNSDAFSSLLNYLSFGVFFNKDEKITISASDNDDAISSVSDIASYTVYFKDTHDNLVKQITQSKNEFRFDYDEIKDFKGSVYVSIKDKANNDTGEILVTTINSNITDTPFMIENNVPEITVIPDEAYYEKASGEIIYNNDFTVTAEFNDEKGTNISGINYASVKVNGVTVYNIENGEPVGEYAIRYEKELEVVIADKTVNGVQIKEGEDNKWNNGKLDFEFYAVDNAGNVAETVTKTYYVDQMAPEISGFAFSLDKEIDAKKDDDGLYKAVSVEDYGFYFKQDVVVTVKADDTHPDSEAIVSGIAEIDVYTVEKGSSKKQYPVLSTLSYDSDVKNIASLTFTIPEGFKGQIYALATDNLGNTYGEDGYVHPNGAAIEDSDRHKTHASATVELVDSTNYTDNSGLPLYRYDDNGIPVKLYVEDTFSGLGSISYKVISPYNADKNDPKGEVTIPSNLKDDGTIVDEIAIPDGWIVEDEDIDANLITKASKIIYVKNNSNNIAVELSFKDRAGNETVAKTLYFSIDTTIPTIDVAYDNNTADQQYTDFYKADRTATMTITERNFRASDVEFKFTNTDGWVPGIDLNSESAWQTVKDDENPDNTKHIAKFTYNHDGDYTFSIDYKDNAENEAEGKNDKFTIDKTIPTVTVTYNNNDAKNGNYYKADRIATITIDEHNFDASRVNIIGTASETAFPTLSAWQNSGDKHIATLAYNADSLYTFDIEFIDMAGNSIADFEKQEFTVDKTNPVLEISGIVDKSANSGEGNIGFIISATDTNFDVFESVITAVRYIEGKFETSKINPGAMGDIANGRQYSVANINTDGIYRITCTVVDKAGNAFSEVILQDANGGKYTENRSGNDVLLTFSVNRDGSVFYVDGYTEKLLKDFYVQNITENVQINEINADTIVEKTITVNGKALVEGDDYTVTLDKGEGTWHRYTYSIKKSVFEKEGEYNIVIFTKDRANNQAYSDIKNVTAKFVVDRTAPTVTIAGLKSDGRYRTDKQVVTVIPSDDGGLLKKLIIRTVNEDGNVIKELINLEGEALLEAVAAGNITFELGEGLYQNVEIICEDTAGNVTGENASGELYENVSVSTNAFLIFWANKVARYMAIAGAALLFGGTGTFAVLKKKRII